MLEEIEEFLKRAAQKRSDTLRPPGQQQAQPQQPQYVQPDVPDVEIIEPEVVYAEPVNEGVAQHVSRHLDTSEYGDSASRLGSTVGMADDKVEARLHSRFDHRLGALDQDDEMASDEPDHKVPFTPSRIAQLLGSPQAIRDAIIVSQILSPPPEHW